MADNDNSMDETAQDPAATTASPETIGETPKAEPETGMPRDVKSALDLAARTAQSTDMPAISQGQMFGEMVWLLSQSASHKNFKLEDLHWYLVPAVRFSQCRLFFGTPDATEARPNPGQIPCGLALWAMFSKEAETRFIEQVKSGKPVRLKPNDWNSGNRLWMVDMVAPFATPENKQIQHMMTDLVQVGLVGAYAKAKDHMVKFFQQDTRTGQRKIMEIQAEMRTQPADS